MKHEKRIHVQASIFSSIRRPVMESRVINNPHREANKRACRGRVNRADY